MPSFFPQIIALLTVIFFLSVIRYGNQVQNQIDTLEGQLEEEREKLARLQEEFNFMSRRGKAVERRIDRVKKADGAARSADAAKSTRESNISRARKSERKPAHHSDGSAGGSLRDSYQSASSGSVFLDDGDIEEFDDGEFDEAGDFGDEELPENDSGVGEVWEESGKPSQDIPLTTPAPPASKNSRQGKQSRARQHKGRKSGQRANDAINDDDARTPTRNNPPPKSEEPEPASPPPSEKSTSNGDEYQARRRGTVIDKADDKKKTRGKPKKTPRKGKEGTAPNRPDETALDNDQHKADDTKTPVQEDFDKAGSADIENGKTSGMGLFDPEYLYPDTAAEYGVQDEDQETGDHPEASQGKAPVSDEPEEQMKDAKSEKSKKPKTKPAKRGQKKTTTTRNRKAEKPQRKDPPPAADDEQQPHSDEAPPPPPEQDENMEDTEQTVQEATSQSTEEKPPPVDDEKPQPVEDEKPPLPNNARSKQPKPPANKSNKNRSRARAAVPVKDSMSTSDEETQTQNDQQQQQPPAPKNTRRTTRNRDTSRSRRSESKGRAAKGKEEPTSAAVDDEKVTKQKDQVGTDQQQTNGETSEDKQKKSDEGTQQRPSDKPRKNSIRGNKGAAKKEADSRPGWRR